MIPIVVAAAAAIGVHLLWTGLVAPPAPRRRTRPDIGRKVHNWLHQAGLADVGAREFALASLAMGLIGAVVGWIVFAGPMAAGLAGLFTAGLPAATYRERRRRLRDDATAAWPRLIEEIRLMTGSLGRSIPQALFDAGARAPVLMQTAFQAAHREWLLSRDFEVTTRVLRSRLADATADVTCETLLVAHQVGGADLDSRLAALAEDRRADVAERRDAASKQAGVRWARRFVLLVPVGMAVAGMSVGNGRAAYGTTQGQWLVVLGLVVVAGCWIWAGRIMALPSDRRAFDDE